MGETGEANISETQSRDSSRWPVGSSTSNIECVLTYVSLFRQLDALQYKQALSRVDTLLTELKRLDDKMILTEVHLLESRIYRGIGNLAKSKVIIPIHMPTNRSSRPCNSRLH